MIEKILTIQNIGKIAYLKFDKADWDGGLPRRTVVYAPNGSGKTTLSMILQSLKDDAELLSKKDTFPDLKEKGRFEQKIELRANGVNYKFDSGKWNKHFSDVDVFNIHFIEDNLFLGSTQTRNIRNNLFDFIAGDDGRKLRLELRDLKDRRDVLKGKLANARNRANKKRITKEERDSIVKSVGKERDELSVAILEKDKRLGLFAQSLFEDFVERVNDNLEKFSRDLRVEKISKHINVATTFYLKIGGNRVTFDSYYGGHEFKYTLSEGDKNALAISVFLAKLSFCENLNERTIVFDDPLTSLDSGRRFLTAQVLAELSDVAAQIIVLTHDATFASELERRFHSDCLSLEIVNESNVTSLIKRSHQSEIATGLFRDVRVLTDFLKSGAKSEFERREVMRCIRPVLEGVARVKYFDIFKPGKWLGDFIAEIDKSKVGDDLFGLKGSVLSKLRTVNDYSKGYHHSSPGEAEQDVNADELHLMVKMTISLIKSI